MAGRPVKHLVKRFGKVEAVGDVSLRIADGEFLVLLGPSGCGKSTILRAVAGPRGRRLGRDRDRRPAGQLRRPGQAQRGHGLPELRALSAHDRLQEHRLPAPDGAKKPKSEIDAAVRRAAGSSRSRSLLDRVPGPALRRTAAARGAGAAIVREPVAFLMDEPLSNLDAQLRIQTRSSSIQLHQRLGITTVYVTHDQIEAMTMGHRIAVMSEGVLQQIGTPAGRLQPTGERLRRDVPRRAADEPHRRRARGLPTAAGASAARGSRSLLAEVDGRPSSSTRQAQGRGSVGLRPEHLRSALGPEERHPRPVQILEPVGSDLYLTVDVPGTMDQVRTDPDSPVTGRQRHAPFDPAGRTSSTATPGRDAPRSPRGRGRDTRPSGRAMTAVVDAVEASQDELCRAAARAGRVPHREPGKEATHFPDEARRCIAYVGDIPRGPRVRARGLGRRPVGDLRGRTADRGAPGAGRRPVARVQRVTSTSCRSATPRPGRKTVRRSDRRRPPLRARRDRHEGRARRGAVGDEGGARVGLRAAGRRRLPRRQRRGGGRERHARDRRSAPAADVDVSVEPTELRLVRGGRPRPLPASRWRASRLTPRRGTSRSTPAARAAAASTRSRRR